VQLLPLAPQFAPTIGPYHQGAWARSLVAPMEQNAAGNTEKRPDRDPSAEARENKRAKTFVYPDSSSDEEAGRFADNLRAADTCGSDLRQDNTQRQDHAESAHIVRVVSEEEHLARQRRMWHMIKFRAWEGGLRR
jgi:hypothetical protein